MAHGDAYRQAVSLTAGRPVFSVLNKHFCRTEQSFVVSTAGAKQADLPQMPS